MKNIRELNTETSFVVFEETLRTMKDAKRLIFIEPFKFYYTKDTFHIVSNYDLEEEGEEEERGGKKATRRRHKKKRNSRRRVK